MRGLLLSALAVSLGSALPGQVVKTILDNGPTQNRYDLVILGDGYTAAQEARFNVDALTVSADLFEEEPYKTYAGYFNVHTVFRASAESGADHPDKDPPIYKNTAYNATYNTGGTGRCLYIHNPSRALADASLAPAIESRVIVLVNDSRYGGCGGTFSVSYNGTAMAEVQVHELGHSFGGLADEYDYPNDTYSGPEPRQRNVTASAGGGKWSQWLGVNGVGAFEGAWTYRYGLYRPTDNCVMRNLGVDHCPVCSEGVVLQAYRTVSPAEQLSPTEDSLILDVGSSQTFSIRQLTPASSNASILWKVDGEVRLIGATTYVLDPATVSLGSHRVEVELQDRTPLVRADPTGLLDYQHEWSVEVVDPSLPDLTVVSVQSPFSVGSGEVMTITTVIANQSMIGGAGAFTLEHFLSDNAELTDEDIYLGSTTVAGVGPGQTETVVRNGVRVPVRANSSIWYLIAKVDRGNQVTENGEDNNTGNGFTVVTMAGCGPYLEYRDPLVYPHDSVTLDPLSGGIAMPTVVAPCASPGTPYLIVWGCSGTAPGTFLSPGITLPLNQDDCTTLGLLSINGPVFSSFYGELDASGVGNATFNWPPGIPVTNLRGHFAALLLDGAGGFTGPSNPVEIFIRH